MQSLVRSTINAAISAIPRFAFASKLDIDLAILGGGPGGYLQAIQALGYVAALKAAQYGFKTACIEKEKLFGGTCLRVGCIPSKTLLNISYKYYDAKHKYKNYGIGFKDEGYCWKTIQKNRVNILTSLGQGIDALFKKNGVIPVRGVGTLISPNQIKVKLNNGDEQIIQAKNIILAMGSEANPFPGLPYDEKVILSSTGALELSQVPKKMAVIGAGVIGLELGSVYNRMGTEVTVIEYQNRILPGMDLEIARTLERSLKAQGMKIQTGMKVISGQKNDKGILLKYEPVQKKKVTLYKAAKVTEMQFDCVLIATGRRPYFKDSGIDKLGIKQNKFGQVEINDKFQTNIPNIYAIGDLVRGPMLAHKAEEEGVAVVEYLKHGKFHINYNVIPAIIYTHPEVASIGKSEENMVAESCHMVFSDAGEMIHEAALAIHHNMTAEQLIEMCHGHPTLSEAIKEAALGIHFKSLHI